jgi:hypothetical protein
MRRGVASWRIPEKQTRYREALVSIGRVPLHGSREQGVGKASVHFSLSNFGQAFTRGRDGN